MNNKKSSILDLDPTLLASLMWIIAILVLFKGYNFIPVIIAFLVSYYGLLQFFQFTKHVV